MIGPHCQEFNLSALEFLEEKAVMVMIALRVGRAENILFARAPCFHFVRMVKTHPVIA